MACYDFFEILTEVFVKSPRRISLLRFTKDFVNRPATPVLRPQNSNRSMILLNDDLNPFLHFGQHGMEIPSHLGFAHVDSSHRLHYGPFSSQSAAQGRPLCPLPC